ncbi:MAG TPA: type II toxin-antitoxin system ParD family antitoxin, partial [Solibacterales bacterium]|nr:type II toxin-antitoxin system ParD family antitoxin [Bryobacterales bacterium]
MPTRNVNLTERLDQFVEAGVASGRYSNASEMIREGLRLLEQHQAEVDARLEWLRTAIAEGDEDIAQGRYTRLTSEDEVNRFLDDVLEQSRIR